MVEWHCHDWHPQCLEFESQTAEFRFFRFLLFSGLAYCFESKLTLQHHQTSESHSPTASGSIQKFDNDYDVIFMCYRCKAGVKLTNIVGPT